MKQPSINETTRAEVRSAYNQLLDPYRTCDTCNHFPVCAIHRIIGRGIEAEFPQDIKELEKPFNTADIAKLCKYYKRKSSNDFGI